LAGIIPAEHIFGTELEFDAHSREVQAISRVRARCSGSPMAP
jgi:hypothetical protein